MLFPEGAHGEREELNPRTMVDLLNLHGQVRIVDVQTVPASTLPAGSRFPEVCLGTDPDHTPAALLDLARQAFEDLDHQVDSPLTGTYVPEAQYRRDLRVGSIRVTVRRDLYLDESTQEIRPNGARRLVAALAHLIAGRHCEPSERWERAVEERLGSAEFLHLPGYVWRDPLEVEYPEATDNW